VVDSWGGWAGGRLGGLLGGRGVVGLGQVGASLALGSRTQVKYPHSAGEHLIHFSIIFTTAAPLPLFLPPPLLLLLLLLLLLHTTWRGGSSSTALLGVCR